MGPLRFSDRELKGISYNTFQSVYQAANLALAQMQWSVLAGLYDFSLINR